MATLHWHEIPFVRLCIPLVAGILLEQALESPWLLLASLAALLFLTALQIFIKEHQRKHHLRTALAFVLLFSVGLLLRKSVEPPASEITNLSRYDGIVSARIRQVTPTHYGSRVFLTITNPVYERDDIRLVAYLRDSNVVFLPGDTLLFQRPLQVILSPKNPYAFDAGAFYRRQGIHPSVALKHDDS
jgi:hypothetical protein